MMRAAARPPLFALCLALLAGCGSSPPIHYHALARQDPVDVPISGNARMLVEILPVAAPERLARSNLTVSDDQGQITVMETERWLAPVADDLRQLVADSLWRTARATDTYTAPVPTPAVALPQFRLAVRLDRFDAVSGKAAVVAGSWSLFRLPNGPAQACRWEGRQTVGGQDAAAIAKAFSDASRQLADRIADSLLRAAASRRDAC